MSGRKLVAFAAIVSCSQIARAQAAPPASVAPAPGAPPAAAPMAMSPLPTGRVTYRTLNEIDNELERIAKANPDRVKRFEMPHKSVLGQTIYGLEITHHVNESSGKPVFVMTGVHHAREWPTAELTMEWIYDLLKNDGADPRFTAMLENVRFIAVPVVNVDGYEMSRAMLVEQKRRNCRVEAGKIPTFAECANPVNRGVGVDLNRNYGVFWGGSGASVSPAGDSHRGAAPFSEPEIQNMRELLASNQVVVALSNHTPDAKVLRVPSANEEPVPADVVPYDSLAQLLGGDLKWAAGPWPKIYYTASGTMEEQAYYSAGTFAFTFENAPGQNGAARFHPPYAFVIDQYFGTGAYPGSSSRAGYIRLIEAAADPRLHSVLEVKAPAGATLTIHKSETLETSPLLESDAASDTTRGAPIKFTQELSSSLIVPRGADHVTWHVNPSMRASQHGSEFIREAWTLTCALGGRSQSVEVFVARGETKQVDVSRCR
jgi:carboxypeptidase T